MCYKLAPPLHYASADNLALLVTLKNYAALSITKSKSPSQTREASGGFVSTQGRDPVSPAVAFLKTPNATEPRSAIASHNAPHATEQLQGGGKFTFTLMAAEAAVPQAVPWRMLRGTSICTKRVSRPVARLVTKRRSEGLRNAATTSVESEPTGARRPAAKRGSSRNEENAEGRGADLGGSYAGSGAGVGTGACVGAGAGTGAGAGPTCTGEKSASTADILAGQNGAGADGALS